MYALVRSEGLGVLALGVNFSDKNGRLGSEVIGKLLPGRGEGFAICIPSAMLTRTQEARETYDHTMGQ